MKAYKGVLMKAINLKAAHLRNPLGIDIRQPLLTWNVVDGVKQTAYQIVAICDGEEFWNTGKVSGSTMQAVYEGPATSRSCIQWKIRVWDEEGTQGPWSEPAFFEFAFLSKQEWTAKWINPEIDAFDPEKNQPASVLTKRFTLENCDNARAYVSAHGMYVLYINGQRVKDNLLTPGTSEYWCRLPYQTFDVSDFLQTGENKIEVTLGDGWYRGCNGNTGTRNVFGKDIALLLQLEVDKKVVLVTDESWQAAQDGPIRFNDIQLGEKVDARMVAANFHGVKVENFGYDNLMCMNTLPIREKESFKPKLIITPNGEKVLDFGQNMAGFVSFKLNAKAGQKLILTHGEYLDGDGNFTDQNLDTVGRKKPLHQVVEYICKDGWNEYSPTMCIFGFQMVKVETDIAITGEEFTAHAVYSDMEQQAKFECDNPLVTQLFHNIIWSQKSNFVDIPTDCPQRERSGWTGDAGVFVHTGLVLMDSYPVFAKWLGECRVNQYPDGKIPGINPRRQPKPSFLDTLYDGSTAWGDASIIISYAMYRDRGDKKILEENYEMMRRWMDYCQKKAKKSRLKNLFRFGPHKNYIIDTGIHYGEWLEAGISMEESMKNIIFNGVPDIATAYFAYSSRLMSEIAGILGKEKDARHYAELYKKTNSAYHFLELPDGRIRSDRQCRYVRPLQLGLLTEEEAKQAASDLNDLVVKNDYHLNTGFLTTGSLCRGLAEYGYVETAYRILLQEDTPGWLYAVKNGATTIWESWEGCNGSTGVSSLNHYSKGAVASWLISGICGIYVQGQNITIRPQSCKLMKRAKAAFDSPVGCIESGWEYVGDHVQYTITIPANTTATFILPDGSEKPLRPGTHQFLV